LIADERAREVLRKHFSEWSGDPQVQSVTSTTRRQIANYYPESGITKKRLEAVDEALKALQ
jgi:hypothetical protein